MCIRTGIKHVYQGVQGACPRQAVTHAIGMGLRFIDIDNTTEMSHVTCTKHVRQAAQRSMFNLSLVLIDMAKVNSQSYKPSKSSSWFNNLRRPISPAPSEQSKSQGNSSKSWTSSLLLILSSKSRSTTPTQSTSSLPLVSSTLDSRGEIALGEHTKDGILTPILGHHTLMPVPEPQTPVSFSVVQGDRLSELSRPSS